MDGMGVGGGRKVQEGGLPSYHKAMLLLYRIPLKKNKVILKKKKEKKSQTKKKHPHGEGQNWENHIEETALIIDDLESILL